MPKWILVLGILAGVAYWFQNYYDFDPEPLPRAEPRDLGDTAGQPGRGLNPFVTDTDHAAPPQRFRVPDVPGSK